MDSPTDWQPRVAKAIDVSGLSRAEIARRVGVARSTVTQWCGGGTRPIQRPHWDKLKLLAVVCGVDFRWLLTGQGDLRRGSTVFQEEELHLLYQLVSLPPEVRGPLEAQIRATFAALRLPDEDAPAEIRRDLTD